MFSPPVPFVFPLIAATSGAALSFNRPLEEKSVALTFKCECVVKLLCLVWTSQRSLTCELGSLSYRKRLRKRAENAKPIQISCSHG